MATFGRYLIQQGILSRAQLAAATQVMVVFGGRLGTILVESGLLTVEEVEEHLARHLGLPCAPPERLVRPSPEALRAVSAALARRCAVFPMWIEKRRLHAAMLDAGHPDAAAAVAFATGLAVVPYVIAQRRLVQLHERHYGIRPDSRFTDTQLLELAGHVQPYGHAAAAADGGDAAGRAPGHAQEDELPRWREAHGMLPLGEGEELCDAEWFDRIHPAPFSAPPPAETPAHAAEAPERSGGARLAPARSAAEAARLEEALVMTADRGAVVPTALRAAAFHARVAAVFDVREGMIHGVLAAGGPAGGRIDGLCVSASEPGMLGAAARGKVFHGRPPSDGIDGAAVRIVAGERPLEAAVLPIAIDGRVVQLLYVDNGPDPLPARSLAALGALCDGVSTAYRRLVSEHTRRHC